DLDAEAAADVGRDHLDVGQGQVERGGDGHADAGGGLGAGVDAQVGAVPAGVDAAAFERHAGAALDVEPERQGVRGGVDGLPGAQPGRGGHLLDQVGADVAGHVLVHEVAAL